MYMKTGRIFFLLTIWLNLALSSQARPARWHQSTYTQPDGTTFTASVRGDEWIKIRTLTDGCAITRDKDGWWCYAAYDSEGRIRSTGCHIGTQAPADIVSTSRAIPYSQLYQRARERRSIVSERATASLEMTKRKAMATRAGEKVVSRCPVILVQFKDQKLKFDKNAFEKMLNTQDKSAKNYYTDQFGSNWEFSFDVINPVTLPNRYSYYGENDEYGDDVNPAEMVAEACKAASSSGSIDFSVYDQDGDGEVDNVYVFYAGLDEAENEEANLIWAHQWYVEDGAGISVTCNGKKINRYACSSELDNMENLSGIGTFCHEYGHTLGLPDLYDTNNDEDTPGYTAAGMWCTTSLMDGGNYNDDSRTPPYLNCIEREILGLSTPVLLEAGKSYTLDPIHKNGTCFRLNTDKAGEYFLFECRSNEGWDMHIGGKGMLVYHIDKSSSHIDKWGYDNEYGNTVNADPSHQCADIVEADGRSDRLRYSTDSYSNNYKNISSIFFPSGATAITGTGKPSLKYWSGKSPDISIAGITLNDGTIRFSVVGSSSAPVVPSVWNATSVIFPDAAIILFESSIPTGSATPEVRYKASEGAEKEVSAQVVSCGNGKYACKIEGLKTGNTPYDIQIMFKNNGVSGTPYELSFMTKKAPPVMWPYIHISEEETGSNGLPLHVVNAGKAEEIIWYFDGQPITPDKDFHFRPESDGVLKAEVMWQDGSKDIIIKELSVTK